ncbi:hypothetical protein GOODEAATRI_006840 [Goodea atripinnis]|uniref:Uncharacterized protein n=1 Tax=Goodea atripinnis TaxID=208336 RepID=A0ABV0P270_9TELE
MFQVTCVFLIQIVVSLQVNCEGPGRCSQSDVWSARITWNRQERWSEPVNDPRPQNPRVWRSDGLGDVSPFVRAATRTRTQPYSASARSKPKSQEVRGVLLHAGFLSQIWSWYQLIVPEPFQEDSPAILDSKRHIFGCGVPDQLVLVDDNVVLADWAWYLTEESPEQKPRFCSRPHSPVPLLNVNRNPNRHNPTEQNPAQLLPEEKTKSFGSFVNLPAVVEPRQNRTKMTNIVILVAEETQFSRSMFANWTFVCPKFTLDPTSLFPEIWEVTQLPLRL